MPSLVDGVETFTCHQCNGGMVGEMEFVVDRYGTYGKCLYVVGRWYLALLHTIRRSKSTYSYVNVRRKFASLTSQMMQCRRHFAPQNSKQLDTQ